MYSLQDVHERFEAGKRWTHHATVTHDGSPFGIGLIEFRGAVFDGDFQNVTFSNCTFHKCLFLGQPRSQFVRCVFRHCSFEGAGFGGISLLKCKVENPRFLGVLS